MTAPKFYGQVKIAAMAPLKVLRLRFVDTGIVSGDYHDVLDVMIPSDIVPEMITFLANALEAQRERKAEEGVN